MGSTDLLFLNQADIRGTGLTMSRTIKIVERVLALHDEGKVNLPSKVILDLGEHERGRINAMPAYVGEEFEICGIKWIAGFPHNPKKYGIPRAHAIIVLNDSETGVPLAIMDGTYVSAMRTGAVSGVGAKYLANPESEVAGIIGCGVQARTQIMALKSVLPALTLLKCFDIVPDNSQRFAQWVSEELSLQATAVQSPQQAVQEADVIVTATVADEPIVKATWLKKGCFFSHIGSFQEEEEEVIYTADKVIVDLWHEVLHRGTPLLAKLYRAGKITEESIYANIGEIIRGKKSGRTSKDERIFYSPLGLGSEDVGVASYIFQQAKQKNLGITLSI
jgi:ornithine cyclodeaminase